MATENEQDDITQQDGVQQQDQQDQLDTTKIPLSEDRSPKSLDAQLDNFIKESTRGPQKPAAAGEGEAGKIDPITGKPVAAVAKPQQQQQQPATGDRTQQGQPIRQVSQVAPRQFGKNYVRNAQSDIVDVRTNRVIAKAGAQYGAFTQLWPELQKAEQENEKLTATVSAIEKANAVAIQAGLTIEDTAMGTRLMAAWKKDKAATIKFLLSQAQEAGTDVSSLTGAQAFDPSIIRNTVQEIVESAMKPFQRFVQQDEQRAEQNEAMQQAQSDVAEFIEQFPDSKVQDAEIGALMSAQGLTLKEAYFALKSHCFENKYDWTKALGPQVSARLQAAQGRAAPNGGGANRAALPQMGGRGGQQQVAVKDRVAKVDASYGDILGDIFTEMGIQS